jgi:hypothetical protein
MVGTYVGIIVVGVGDGICVVGANVGRADGTYSNIFLILLFPDSETNTEPIVSTNKWNIVLNNALVGSPPSPFVAVGVAIVPAPAVVLIIPFTSTFFTR